MGLILSRYPNDLDQLTVNILTNQLLSSEFGLAGSDSGVSNLLFLDYSKRIAKSFLAESIAASMDGSQLCQHSSIPQFILDTEHPWIIKHQSVLERLPDVESFFYSPPGTKYRTPTSQLQHHGASARPATTGDELDPHLEVPADLFTTLIIDNRYSYIRRAGWPNDRRRLLELQRCPAAALARVHSFDVKVWVHGGVHTASEDLQAEEWQDLEGPAGDELLDLFASVLTAMTGLERLRWAMLPEFAQRIREGPVGGCGLWLPSVSRLEVAAFSNIWSMFVRMLRHSSARERWP